MLYNNGYKKNNYCYINPFNIPQNIFVEKKDYLRFSKKNIISNIRIAINHNDNSDKLKIIRVNETAQRIIITNEIISGDFTPAFKNFMEEKVSDIPISMYAIKSAILPTEGKIHPK